MRVSCFFVLTTSPLHEFSGGHSKKIGPRSKISCHFCHFLDSTWEQKIGELAYNWRPFLLNLQSQAAVFSKFRLSCLAKVLTLDTYGPEKPKRQKHLQAYLYHPLPKTITESILSARNEKIRGHLIILFIPRSAIGCGGRIHDLLTLFQLGLGYLYCSFTLLELGKITLPSYVKESRNLESVRIYDSFYTEYLTSLLFLNFCLGYRASFLGSSLRGRKSRRTSAHYLLRIVNDQEMLVPTPKFSIFNCSSQV